VIVTDADPLSVPSEAVRVIRFVPMVSGTENVPESVETDPDPPAEFVQVRDVIALVPAVVV
jgi:hypothetical protein